MENYERLTFELLGNGLTPKAKYELVKQLLAVKALYKATKLSLEHDVDWFGSDSSEYQRALHHLRILNGLIEFEPDHDLKEK